MPTKHRSFQTGSYYHVYNRGNRKQNIFFNACDYSRFVNKIRDYKESTGVEIICYCLMPNHIHLLIRPDTDESVTNFMLRLSTGHSKYINIKYNLVGSLFQGRFKAINIDNENYFKHLIRYIHINPLSLGLSLKKLHKYKWSSFGSYLNPRKSSLVDMRTVKGLISIENHREFVESYIEDPDDSLEDISAKSYYIDFEAKS